ncbi:MAG: basic secretory protein-like protein [Gemmatimonadota bacterium]
MRPGRGGTLSYSLIAVLLLSHAVPVSAQYFGRQKVQYEDYDWQVLETDHFDIHFYPAEQVLAQDAARMSERWYTRLSSAFEHQFDRKPLIFYADHPDFQQTNTTMGMLSEGTGGFTESTRNRVVMPFTGTYFENDHVLGHELVHVFQYDLAVSAGGGGLQGMGRLPLWLVEGMAEYLSLGRRDTHTAMWMRDAALRGELPTIQQLTTDRRFFPYRYGQALWAYVAGRYGDRAVTEVYRYATRAGFEVALRRVLGVSSEQLSQDWITSIRATYLPLMEGRQRPQDAGDPVLYDPEAGAMNLSPVVSPDGQYVAFFGRRQIFTVDLYIADARTGEVVETLTSPNQDEHFDALSFIQSAGSWSPDGRKFAFIVFGDGDNQIAIIDIASGDIERRIGVEGVGAVSTVAWSPDGGRIAFSGMAGGISDLYVLDLASGSVQQLTDDRYAQIHPSWSPDGRTLAYATDREGTDFDRMVYGPMRIGLLDVGTGAARVLDLFPQGKHMNPQYAPDGRDIYFLADPDGFTDLYRVQLASGQVYRVTQLATGISGISALSPALSVASNTGRVMFSVFQNSGNNIYGLDQAQAQGTPVDRNVQALTAASILPPVDAMGTGLVYEYLADPVNGLPQQRQFAVREYESSLGLDYIAPPSVGIAGSTQFGMGVSGGIGFLFSDMMGDNQLQAVVQANGGLKDIGAQAMYLDAGDRWNWGVIGGHIPILYGYAFVTAPDAQGFQYVVEERQRIFVDQAQLMTSYPFSQTRRFEVTGGYTRYSYDYEQIQYPYFRGQPTGEQPTIQEVPSPDPLNFVESSIALVGDNSYFGLTSPVAGERWRLEVSPTFGTLTYQSVLADYRRYFLRGPVTLALRGMHFGRYGEDAEGLTAEQRVLRELFVGYETLVRGYAYESFDIGKECGAVGGSQEDLFACPVFDRLFGTRLAVANLELRIPVLGVPELGLINFPYLPTEITPFIDAGLAWSADAAPTLGFARSTVERVPVFSAGVSARMNILGYVIFEAYYAYPFQRPDKGAHFGFNLAPGW